MTNHSTVITPDAPVFLSYSRDDRDNAIKLYDQLKAAGFTLWRDVHDIPPGHPNWWGAICEAIDGCSSMVLCLSVASLNSTVVGDEWTRARKHGKRIIPVIVDEVFKHPDVLAGKVVVPRWMTSSNIPDLRPDAPERETAFGNLVTTLRESYTPVKYKITVKAEQLPHNFVPRPREFEPLVTALAVDEHTETVALTAALRGAGGYGKTTLAKAVCRDWRISGAYPDGIFWMTLGEKLLTMSPDVRENELLKRLLDLVFEISDQRPQVQTLDAASELLRQAVDGRKLLIVIDDVWALAHLKPFMVGGKHHAVVISTRFDDCVPKGAGIVRQDVDAMADDDALALLAFGVEGWESERAWFEHVAVRRLGRCAQLLSIVNGALVGRLTPGKPLKQALSEIQERLDYYGVSAFDAEDSEERERAFGRTLEVGIERLKPEDQARFRDLGIFPPDVAIPLTTLRALWSLKSIPAQDFCEKLAKSALVQDYDERTLTTHDVTLDYLAKTLPNASSVHAQLLDAWGDAYALPDEYAWRYYGHHLMGGERADCLRELLLDIYWLQAKLDAADVNALMADCDYLSGDHPIGLIKSALTMSAHVLEQDKSALAQQLFARLYSHIDLPEIAGIREAVKPTLKLLPLHEPTHAQAGGMLLRVLAGHEREIYGALELKDGRLLSWSEDKTLRLWGADGAVGPVLEGHEDLVLGALELRDGRLLSWSGDKTLRLWGADGTVGPVLAGHEGTVYGALELRDGRLLSWADDTKLRLWGADGKAGPLLEGHERDIYGALELVDRRVLSWSEDGTLRLWSADGVADVVLEGHQDSVDGALELKDERLLSWSDDGTLRLWSADGVADVVLEGHQDSVDGALELKDGRLLSWSDDGTLRLWNAKGAFQMVLEGHLWSVRGALELQDGRFLSWSGDWTLRLWSREGVPQTVMEGHMWSISGAKELQDGRLISWSQDGTMRLWNADGTVQEVLTYSPASTGGVEELRDGRLLSWDEKLYLWKATNVLQSSQQVHRSAVDGLQALRDGRLLSWSENGTLHLWGADATPQVALTEHKRALGGARQLRNGRLLSWSEDGTLRLWDADGRAGPVLQRHERAIRGALELEDGRLLSWSDDMTLRLWSAKGALQMVLEGHNGLVLGALELRDRRLLSWSEDRKLRLWNAEGAAGPVLEGHEGAVRGALELKDGQLLSWSFDGTLRLWDAIGTVGLVLEGHEEAVWGALQLGDGRFLSWSLDETLRLWGADGSAVDVINTNVDPILLRTWFEKHHGDWNDFASKYYEGSQHAGVFARSNGGTLSLYN